MNFSTFSAMQGVAFFISKISRTAGFFCVLAQIFVGVQGLGCPPQWQAMLFAPFTKIMLYIPFVLRSFFVADSLFLISAGKNIFLNARGHFFLSPMLKRFILSRHFFSISIPQRLCQKINVLFSRRLFYLGRSSDVQTSSTFCLKEKIFILLGGTLPKNNDQILFFCIHQCFK